MARGTADVSRSGPVPFLALTAALALLAALVAGGRVHPDEIFQTLEPAHRLAFGTGERTWEWVQGIRSWAVPGIFGGALVGLHAIGIDHPRALVVGLWILCSTLQAFGTLALFRAVEEDAGAPSARVAAFVHSTWGGYAIYAARTLGDALAVPPVLGALLFAQRARDDDRVANGGACGVLLGLAIAARYPSLVFALPLGAALLVRRRWGAFGGFIGGLAAVLGALGVLDALTWGRPFHSLIGYLGFNQPYGTVLSRFGASPGWYYLAMLPAMAFVPLLYPLARSIRRGGIPLACLAVYGLAIQIHPHKEPRFLLPVLPLLTLCAAPACAERWERLRGRLASRTGVLAVYAAWSIASASWLLPFSFHRGIVDAEIAAGRDPALTHLLVGTDPWRTGGRFYLHRDVPVTYASGPDLDGALADPRFSHLLTDSADAPDATPTRLRARGWTETFRRGSASVWKR